MYKYVVSKIVEYGMGDKPFIFISPHLFHLFFLKPLGFSLGLFSKQDWFMVHPFVGFVRGRFKGDCLKYCAWHLAVPWLSCFHGLRLKMRDGAENSSFIHPPIRMSILCFHSPAASHLVVLIEHNDLIQVAISKLP